MIYDWLNPFFHDFTVPVVWIVGSTIMFTIINWLWGRYLDP